jgi:hypothetical protein
MKKIYLLLSLCLIQFISQAQTIPAYVPTNGLVGWWPFNGNANDESGNGNNGTVNGATLTTDRYGNGNKSYLFDGISNRIAFNLNSINNLFPASTESSSSIWIKTTDLNGPLISMQGINGIEYNVHIGTLADVVQNPGHYGILVRDNCCGTGNNSFASNCVDNSWHMLTIVRLSDGTLKFYKDAILEFISGSGQNGALGFDPTYMTFGADYSWVIGSQNGCMSCNSNDQQHYSGSLDDVGIWNRALTQQEITALYQAQVCSLSITSQPTNQSTTTGNNTSFNVGVTATNCNNPTTYQWQTNTGFGWQTLQNAGQYIGVNTSTLHVSNVGSTNTNQLFRCLIQSGNIADTTQTATLSVVNTGNTALSAVTHAIPYQAVVRDAAGNPLINHPLTVRCTLHDNTASGTSIYQETHTITTNNLGLFTLHIGTGVASIGNIDSIHWALYKKYLQVEFDTTAQGVSYIDLGTQQLMAVPYALYAETAGSALNGPKGDKGDAGVNGMNGVDGSNGTNGQNGVNGADGVSVTSANITNDSLYLSLSNSQTLNAGKLSGGLSNGTNVGDVLTWDGSSWVSSSSNSYSSGITTMAVTGITGTSALSGGFLGIGIDSTAIRGVCWSINHNPTISDNVTYDSSGIGNFTSILTGLISGTTYYVRAYAASNLDTIYGNEVSFTTISGFSFEIGDAYQGGRLAYLFQPGDAGYVSGQVHGLIAAPYDQGTGTYEWGCHGTILGGTFIGIGKGQINTASIVNGCNSANIAAYICDTLVLNGYNDWYLPSRDELNKLYINKNAIGLFAEGYYWSSSEAYNDTAWMQNFYTGYGGIQIAYYKYQTNNIRAVRSF